jgi:hypothetical protein
MSPYPIFVYQEFPMSGVLTKMDENSEWASSEFASERLLCPQYSALFS